MKADARTHLDEVIKACRQNRPQYRPQEVNPEITWEVRRRDARAETTSRVHRSSRVVYAGDLDDEEREADADGCDEGVLRFFSGEHEDCED